MSTVRRLLAVALALAACTAPAAAQNLVQNAGFESPFVTGDLTLAGCPAGFVWCIGQGSIDLVQARWEPGEGRQSIDLNGTAPGSVYQDLATTPGQAYDLSFRFSGHPDGDPTKTMQVVWDGLDLGSFAWIVAPPQTFEDMLWSRLTIRDIPATATTTRLEFRSTTTSPCVGSPDPSCGPALDAVNVVAVATIPEPATLALLGTGLLVLAAAARRQGGR